MSMVYHALAHWLANCVADVLAGATRPRDHGWVPVYRGVDHRQVKQQCRQGRIPTHLAPTLRRFAAELAEMQGRRHSADYDPKARFSKRDAVAFIASANRMLLDLQETTPAEKRALAIHVLFKERPGSF
ncbi:MAG: hypothetical protein OXR05_04695 [Gemmatimonadota bacterium]|nr:hypothetical protein [Gemmatimonadota bacterium]